MQLNDSKTCFLSLNFHETNLSCKAVTNLFFLLTFPQVLNCLGERKKFQILLQADHRLNHIWPRKWPGWNHKLCFFMEHGYHRLDHICPEYGQPGTINLYDPEYDQPGIILWVWWQSMIDLFMYGRETRESDRLIWTSYLLPSFRPVPLLDN